MKDKPSRRGPETPKSDLEKLRDIAVKGALEAVPGGGVLHDLLKARAEALSQAVKKKSEERLQAFYADLLHAEGSMDGSVAEAMVDDRDFQALLRACLADIESEKTTAYTKLARAIASGRLDKEWRRHYILSLRDMSARELSCLQKALVARNHQLVPGSGSRMDESDFLKPGAPGSLGYLVIQNLVSKGFVHEGKLSSTGVRFIQACMKEGDLTPAAIGYRTWTQNNVAILSYEIGDPAMDALATGICDELRRHCIKSSTFALTRSTPAHARMIPTHGILLVGDIHDGLARNMESLLQFCRKRPLIAVNVKPSSAPLPNDFQPKQSLSAVGRGVQEVAEELRRIILQDAV